PALDRLFARDRLVAVEPYLLCRRQPTRMRFARRERGRGEDERGEGTAHEYSQAKEGVRLAQDGGHRAETPGRSERFAPAAGRSRATRRRIRGDRRRSCNESGRSTG